jgi:hypothetical protein
LNVLFFAGVGASSGSLVFVFSLALSNHPFCLAPEGFSTKRLPPGDLLFAGEGAFYVCVYASYVSRPCLTVFSKLHKHR